MASEPATSKSRTMANGNIDAEKESDPLVNSNSEKSRPVCTLLQISCLFVAALALTQYAYGIWDHSSLMKMQFAGSVLLFVSSIEFIYTERARRIDSDAQGVFLLYRTAATVFYIACLFLNLTHCLEEITDLHHMDDDAKVALGNSTMTTEETFVVTEEALVEESFFKLTMRKTTLIITLTDLILKTAYTAVFNVFSLSWFTSFVSMVIPSILTLAVYFYQYTQADFLSEWFEHHIEPLLAIVFTVVSIGIAVYSLIRKKQFLLAEGPKNFDVERISELVKAQNASLEKIDHVHASSEWPRGFIVSLKAYVRVEKNNKNWVAQAADDFSHLKSLLHTEIKAVGAKEVIVEPVFVDRNEPSTFVDAICIDPSCHNEDVGCCTNPKPQV